MSDVDCLPYREAHYFSNLICDYLEQDEKLKGLYGNFPDKKGFAQQLKAKAAFPKENREVLVKALQKQYKRLNQPQVGFEKVEANISALAHSKTFTVTTGHQLNIFTGPLYFIYKIVSTINLAKQLQEWFPDYHFVPVYWMATEDHDFEEINHINQYGGRLSWDREASGAVGHLDPKGLKPVIDELINHLGVGTHAEYLEGLFCRSYEQHHTLADATLYLAHELFADQGLVIVDADQVDLKKQAIPLFQKDLLNHTAHENTNESTAILQEHYFEQVLVREINLFYLDKNLRERLEKQGKHWQVLNTEIRFNEEGLLKELNDSPEKFSPNVVLRPMYQEVILPNLAYIGGGGELAYWLQLKQAFEANEVLYPILVLRNSALIATQKQAEKAEKLGLKLRDFFNDLHEIKKLYVKDHAPVNPELEPYEQKLQKMFDDLEEIANLTEKSMLGAVNAQRQKQLNGLEKLKKKLIRAEKRRQSDEMERIERLYFELFPNGSLQERHDNFAVYYKEYGSALIPKLLESFKPLDFCFSILSVE